jgi:hypothetical protein
MEILPKQGNNLKKIISKAWDHADIEAIRNLSGDTVGVTVSLGPIRKA